ncbi:hypothetical protein [Bradyrhizobium sp. DASA03120]|uniref:hypothetical protein n=1 Tax=Bradyrhizobium sp. SMVTL-02 TaxID=3395917 RepID=UPI003F727C76
MRTDEPLRRNTPAWAMDRFRSDALPRFLDDLAPVSETGISEAECQRVRATLNQFTDHASWLPDGGVFRRAIWQHLQDFHDLYSKWNDVQGTDDASRALRFEIIREIRGCRNRLAKAVRVNSHLLNKELDLKLVDAYYKSLGDLVRAAPRLFLKLSEAVARYSARRAP